MPFDFTADVDNMILAGAPEAFTLSAGTPSGAQFIYGTTLVGSGLTALGIVVDDNIKSTGDRQQIKGGSGVTIAFGIIDPGEAVTVSCLFPKAVPLPKVGKYIAYDRPSKSTGGTSDTVYGVVLSYSIKWSREGWRMLDLEIESKEAWVGMDFWSYYVEADSTLGTQIDSN